MSFLRPDSGFFFGEMRKILDLDKLQNIDEEEILEKKAFDFLKGILI